MTKADPIRRKFAEVVRQQRDLLDDLARTLADGEAKPGERERLQARLARLMAEHQRLSDEMKLAELERREISGAPRTRASGRTLRDQTLDILDEIGVAMSPSAVAEFAGATMGAELQSSRFASLRRDEERASRRDTFAKPAWIVPALSAANLTPIPRLLTSSAWTPERRLIAARTLRVNHLRSVLAYLKRFELLQATDPARADVLGNLMWRHARAIPGATTPGEQPDLDRIRAAAQAELELIEPEDEAERKQAVPSFAKLSRIFQLWGRPSVIDGTAASGRGS